MARVAAPRGPSLGYYVFIWYPYGPALSGYYNGLNIQYLRNKVKNSTHVTTEIPREVYLVGCVDFEAYWDK